MKAGYMQGQNGKAMMQQRESLWIKALFFKSIKKLSGSFTWFREDKRK